MAKNIFNLPKEKAVSMIEMLTPQERQVAEMLAMGTPNAAIAKALKLSPKTCDIHRGQVKAKLKTETHGVARVWFAAIAG